jgi:hypothetical protein
MIKGVLVHPHGGPAAGVVVLATVDVVVLATVDALQLTLWF